MAKILIIDDESIVQKFLSEFAEENATIINISNNILKYNDITLNQENYEVFKGKEKIFLTNKEFKILKLLMQNPNKMFSRENLLTSIWGYDYYGDEKVVNTHIKNIRKKLKSDIIKTVRGAGYKLNSN